MVRARLGDMEMVCWVELEEPALTGVVLETGIDLEIAAQIGIGFEPERVHGEYPGDRETRVVNAALKNGFADAHIGETEETARRIGKRGGDRGHDGHRVKGSIDAQGEPEPDGNR